MKATDLLKKQHQLVRGLLQNLEDAEVEQRAALLGELSRNLRAHATIEEELLYPKLEEQEDLEDLMSESFHEHDEMESALADLERCAVEDEEFPDLVDNLAEILLHHVEEEESEVVPRMEEMWTSEFLSDLGREMLLRFEELARGRQPEVTV